MGRDREPMYIEYDQIRLEALQSGTLTRPKSHAATVGL